MPLSSLTMAFVTMDVTTMDKDGIEMIEFKVTDDGEGMSAEGVAKVFEEYEQAEDLLLQLMEEQV